MSVTIPVHPSKFKIMQYDFGTTIAQSLWAKSAQVQNYADASVPVGTLMYFVETQGGIVSPPNPSYWQLCDGSTVSNANSLLNGQVLPDLRGVFLKHPDETETALTTSGSNNRDFTHNHSGLTNGASDRSVSSVKSGTFRATGGLHFHTIASDLGFYDIIPLTFEVQIYVRVV